jgi:hypothetical protein
MAIVAGSGFGKTVFAGTAPKALFLTTDPEGTMSAARLGSTAEEWKIQSWDELGEAYIWLRDEGVGMYDWLIIDNGTECQKFAMAMAMQQALAKHPDRSPYVPDKREYQINQNAFIEFVLKMHSLPINIIWTFHRKGMEDGDGAEFYSVGIQGGQGEVAQLVLGYMNIIAMGERKQVLSPDGTKKEVRRYYTSHTGPYRGKDRFAALGNYKDDLTIPKMMDLLDAKKSKTPAKATAARRRVTTRSSK